MSALNVKSNKPRTDYRIIQTWYRLAKYLAFTPIDDGKGSPTTLGAAQTGDFIFFDGEFVVISNFLVYSYWLFGVYHNFLTGFYGDYLGVAVRLMERKNQDIKLQKIINTIQKITKSDKQSQLPVHYRQIIPTSREIPEKQQTGILTSKYTPTAFQKKRKKWGKPAATGSGAKKGEKSEAPNKKNPAKKAYICPKCEHNISKAQYSIICGQCQEYYHKSCSKLTAIEFAAYEKNETDSPWICMQCVENNYQSETEQSTDSEAEKITHVVNKRLSQLFSKNDATSGLGKQNNITIRRPSQVSVPKKINNSQGPTNSGPSIDEILKIFNDRFEQFETSLNFKWDLVEDINKSIKEMQNEYKQLKRENEVMKRKIGDLEKKVELLNYKQDKEQIQAKKKNLVITGPYVTKDTAKESVLEIFTKINSPLQASDVKVNLFPSKSEDRPIILVELPDEDTRNRILEAKKEIENLDTELCSTTSSRGQRKRKIFISEDLDKNTRNLLMEAQETEKGP
ncbi:unnamed protein product [Ceutorhynchus assimilis]|uniref:PHD-type domain-containing protein n=1 Tax=Ceutorhynchus assimilis TaxID=467358 RepID=A0A9N9N1H5_9CUCU|nr:unnamed protein product [Ceutorhynchus assimilis]